MFVVYLLWVTFVAGGLFMGIAAIVFMQEHGFGLAVARRTVEAHGGRVDLDRASEEGVGATFVVELPLAEERASTSDTANP